MNTRTLLLQLLLTAMTVAVALVYYHRFIAAGARFGYVDAVEVYRVKEKELLELVTKPSVTEEERQKAIAAAEAFGKALPAALEELTAECGCIVLVRAAFASPTPGMVDLTPQLRQKIGL